jgi:hypothetical protein
MLNETISDAITMMIHYNSMCKAYVIRDAKQVCLCAQPGLHESALDFGECKCVV